MAKQKRTHILSAVPVLCNTAAVVMQGDGRGGTDTALRLLRAWCGAAGKQWLAAVKQSAVFRRTAAVVSELRGVPRPGREFDFAMDLLTTLATVSKIDSPATLPKAPAAKALAALIDSPAPGGNEDAALRRIIKRAVKRFNFQEGSLLLFDEAKQDLFFHLSVSPVADTLLGLRVPIENSIAGSILRTGQPVYIADVLESGQHYGEIDRKTGMRTESILGAPLLSRDRPLGVIELVNRKTAAPCGQDDIEEFVRVARDAEVLAGGILLRQAICDLFRRCVNSMLGRKKPGTLDELQRTSRRWKMAADARLAFQAAIAVQRVAESGRDVTAMCVKLLRRLRGLAAAPGIAFPQLGSRHGKKA
ncbi:MAG: GAF domain-containing protein [Planctomycetes bacterium]|nr:GAF domain-containing protein [Planctomycetota bacterium]